VLLYWVWLSEHPVLTPRQKGILLQHFRDAEDIFFAEGDKLESLDPQLKAALGDKDTENAEKILRECARKDIRLMTIGDPEYPARLRNIPEPPLVLYYKGTFPAFGEQPVIGVVGTRKATPYGLTAARKISRQIALHGGLVVSGCADGADTAAMRGAMEAGKPVVGILGNGVDVVYPPKNRDLYAEVERNGCLISVYPPGSKPERWHFPHRNRIISGIANGVLVSEAPKRSGALITAKAAMEQGRDVYVIPGNIDIPNCEGSNALLQEGAAAVFSGWDIMGEYERMYPGVVVKTLTAPEPEIRQEALLVAQPETPLFPAQDKKDIDKSQQNSYSGIENSGFTEEEQKILSLLDSRPKHMDDVIAQARMSAGKVLSIITKLTVKGVVISHPGRMVSYRLERK